MPEIKEQLTIKLSLGYYILQQCATENSDFGERSKDVNKWIKDVRDYLFKTFPTPLEANEFTMATEANPSPFTTASQNPIYEKRDRLTNKVRPHLKVLDKILSHRLMSYPDLPLEIRLYVEDIDSFSKVRSVNPNQVISYLQNGRTELSEESVQLAFERVLSQSFHKTDWAGEQNDLFTTNIVVNGKRRQAAFLLKGAGCKSKVMEIKDCGKNGDQILRLFKSPADLFFLQFIGPISENVVEMMEIHSKERRQRGFDANFCLIDGQDTLRVLKAYNELFKLEKYSKEKL